MPSFDDVKAQPMAVRVLRGAVERGRVASAYLFDGPSGVGKERAALALAGALLCKARPGRGCDGCDACKRIAHGNHPDVRIFRPRDEGDRNLPIRTVREQVLPFAQFAPFEGPAALAIFADADVAFPEHHTEAANALLKTLEEPRPKVHFVLLASRPDRLLPTIRSRCQRVRFQRLPDRTLDELLSEAGIAQAERAAAIALAGGRADRALQMAREGTGEKLFELALRVDAVLARGGPGAVADLCEELAKAADVELGLEAMVTFYRDVAAVALGAAPETLSFRMHAATLRERAAALAARAPGAWEPGSDTGRLAAGRAAHRAEALLRVRATLARHPTLETQLAAALFDLRRTS
jgi:DNA polymerase-3 subunit delta'